MRGKPDIQGVIWLQLTNSEVESIMVYFNKYSNQQE